MKALVKDRLPKFTKEETKLINGSYDFIGINYYTSNYAQNNPNVDPSKPSLLTDLRANSSSMNLIECYLLFSNPNFLTNLSLPNTIFKSL